MCSWAHLYLLAYLLFMYVCVLLFNVLPVVSYKEGGLKATELAVARKRSAKVRRAFNPLGLPESTIQAPEEAESQDVFWDRLQFNVKVLASTCVSLNSRATYSTSLVGMLRLLSTLIKLL